MYIDQALHPVRHVSALAHLQADVERYKEIAQRVLPLVGDTVELINDAWEDGKRILIEGANATMLDLDFGTYPFVTSSNPSIGGVASGLGLAPTKFQAIIGVVCTHQPPHASVDRHSASRICQHLCGSRPLQHLLEHPLRLL